MGERRAGLVRVAFRRGGQAAATAAGGYEQLFRSDLFVCAGLNLGAGFGDNTAECEAEGTGADTAAFEPYLIAIPEVAWATGTIATIGFWAEGGPGFKAWAGVFADTTVASNHYPGAASAIFEHGPVGFDGMRFRSGAISVSVTKGQVFWVVTQTNVSNHQRGYRESHIFRACLGENTPDPLTAATSFSYMGFRSAAVVAYNAALAAFPAGGSLLNIGLAPIGSGSANSSLRPSTFVQLTPS